MGTVPSLRNEQEHQLDGSLGIRHHPGPWRHRPYPQRVAPRHSTRQAHVATQLPSVQEAFGSRLPLVSRRSYRHELSFVQYCLL